MIDGMLLLLELDFTVKWGKSSKLTVKAAGNPEQDAISNGARVTEACVALEDSNGELVDEESGEA